MIKLLLDQGLPRSTVELLKADGWDVVHGEVQATIEAGAAVTVTERAIRVRRLPITGDTTA